MHGNISWSWSFLGLNEKRPDNVHANSNRRLSYSSQRYRQPLVEIRHSRRSLHEQDLRYVKLISKRMAKHGQSTSGTKSSQSATGRNMSHLGTGRSMSLVVEPGEEEEEQRNTTASNLCELEVEHLDNLSDFHEWGNHMRRQRHEERGILVPVTAYCLVLMLIVVANGLL